MSGAPGTNYTVTLPAFATAERPGSPPEPGVTSLTVLDLVSFSRTVSATTSHGKVGPGGTDDLYVGGTLQVPVTARAGRYRAEITVTLDQE